MNRADARRRVWQYLLGHLNSTALDEVFTDIDDMSETDQELLEQAWNWVSEAVEHHLGPRD